MPDDHHHSVEAASSPDNRKHSRIPRDRTRYRDREDFIVGGFAVMGFVGSVVLYRTASAPPIIIAFYLATGVAALVYRFLGGIEGSTFVWGALKLGGTLAARVGIALGVVRYLESEAQVVVQPQGQYELQWAGNGWLGTLNVAKDGSATIDMWTYRQCGSTKKVLQLLNKTGEGKVQAVENLTKLRVQFPVQFLKYDDICNVTGVDGTTILIGDLHRHVAFAGTLRFQNKFGETTGGTFLVKGYHSGLHY